MTKVMISIDDELLREIDARTTATGLSRSAFIRNAAKQLLFSQPQMSPNSVPNVRGTVEEIRQLLAGGLDRPAVEIVREMRDSR